MIPAEIVVTLVLCYLVFKVVIWWTRAMNAHDENVKLKAENAQLKADLATLADTSTSAPPKKPAVPPRPPTTTQTRRPQVGDDIR